MEKYIQVITSVEKKEDGETIAKGLLEKRLAACVQVLGPMTSYFWWQGKIDTAGEYLCLIKTKKALYPKVEAVIKEMHPYEVAEILATEICVGSKEYLAWVDNEVSE